jgi:lysophospholipase L1-like esterase
VQIWDNPEGSGGLWNNQKHANKPLFVADRPPGQWNTFRILMVGDRVTVYLNGILVVDDVPLENYWQRDQPIYPRGQIELQNHGSHLCFKNIYLRELPRRADVPQAPPAVLKRGDRVAIAGDSITEQRLYSRFIEDYLLACTPQLELSVTQFGWSGETAGHFAGRMENDVLPFKPTVVTTCYGMNDGGYRKFEPAIGKGYEAPMRTIVERFKAAGATVVVGSPGAVDTFTFNKGGSGTQPDVYNDNLAHLRDVARDLARDNGQLFANVHDPMILAMLRAKPVLGKEYHVCGGDGFHPSSNGHLVMAYAFLKALRLDGQIGTITLDLAAAQPQCSVTDGHKVVSATNAPPVAPATTADKTGSAAADKAPAGSDKPGPTAAFVVELESTRYPFCFFGDDKSPDSTRGILPYVPFNAELNRLTLIVRNLAAPAATVTWGSASKRFTKEQLEAGVNLAAEFLDNPFCGPFRKLDEAVARKQEYETTLITGAITNLRTFRDLLGDDAEGAAAIDKLRSRLLDKYAKQWSEVRAVVVAVRHTITVKPEP